MVPVEVSQASKRRAPSKRPEDVIQAALALLPADASSCEPFFRTEVWGLLQWLNDTERQLAQKPEAARSPELRRDVDARWTGVIAQGEAAVAGIHRPVARKAVKAAFRAAIAPWLSNNPFILRAQQKPRGYPGDFLMMEPFYIHQHKFAGGLAGVLDRFLMDRYDCVRNRKDRSKAIIRATVERLAKAGRPIRILTLGGGPCREWHELNEEIPAAERRGFSQIELTYLDQDQEAIDYCRARFAKMSLVRSIEFSHGSLLGFAKSPDWIGRSGTFDLVYGFGIADYFHDEMLSSVIASGFGLLATGGELSVPHKSDAGFNYELADWICDWTFVKRTEQEYVELFKKAVSMLRIPFEFSMDRDPTQAIMFGTAKRLA